MSSVDNNSHFRHSRLTSRKLLFAVVIVINLNLLLICGVIEAQQAIEGIVWVTFAFIGGQALEDTSKRFDPFALKKKNGK